METQDRPKCVCEDCGKQFLKGDEGDNERFCLRCEYIWRAQQGEFEDFQDFD
jgi:hypothetical protein